MKKIVMLIHSLKGGGAERVCVNLANELVNQNVDVTIITLYDDNKRNIGRLNSRVKLITLSKNKNIFIILNKMYKYLKENNIKKVLVFNNNITLIVLMIRKIMGIEYNIIARNINTLSIERKFEKSLIKKYVIHYFIKKYYKCVDLCICQSIGMANDLKENYNFDEDKIRVINNPVNEVLLNYQLENPKMVTSTGVRTLMFIGRLEKQKGLEYLLEAFKLCTKKVDNINLLIVGEGSLKEKLKRKVVELNLDDKVIFENFADNVIEYYVNSNLVVLSSLFEGFPNVLIESIALGIPVVSFDCPSGPSEIIIDGKNGFLAKYLDVNDLSVKIIKALGWEWNRVVIKETAQKYEPENITKEYQKVIKVY